MKSLLKIAFVAAGMFMFTYSQAATMTRDTTRMGRKVSRTAHKVGHATAKTATAVAHKTSEVAAKGAAAITDKRYEGKCGPHGETVYINKDSRYFYVDKRGHREYLRRSQLRNSSKMKM
jgi:hypothetical protein